MAATSDRAQALRCAAVVGSAYLVQGIVAVVGAVLLGALAAAGTPIEQQAGLLAGGAVPWVLKCVVALGLDVAPSWSMRQRAAVLAGLQLCVVACLWGLAVAWTDHEAGGALGSIAVAWVSLNFVAAVQDVLVDTLALDTLRAHQPWTAMAMSLGHALGMGVLGPMLGGTIGEHGMAAGFRVAAIWVAVVAAVCAALLWLPGRPARPMVASLRERLPSGEQLLALLGLALLFTALLFGTNLTQGIAFEFLYGYLEWTVPDATRILAPIGTIAGLVGVLAMGPLAAKLGPARATMLVGAALGLTWLGFAGASAWWREPAMIPSFAACEGLLQPALLVGLHAIALIAAARTPMPTTVFVLLMSAINLPRALAPLFSPTLIQLGWVGAFAACGALQLITIAGLWPLRGWTSAR